MTATPVSTPVSIFTSVTSSSLNSIENREGQTNQLNSKRSYSESNNNNNNSNVGVNSRNNECNSKIEIYESRKYTGKYYITDPKTNAAVWIEIISKLVNNYDNNVHVNTIFNMNSNIDNFYFIDPKSNLKVEIFKAHFIPK